MNGYVTRLANNVKRQTIGRYRSEGTQENFKKKQVNFAEMDWTQLSQS
jgi:hypothetical protein